jgi:type I restriction enzyme S subunit
MNGGWMSATLNDLCVVDWGNTNLTKKAYVADGKYLAVSAAGCDGRIGHKEHAKHTPVLSAIGALCGKMFFPTEDFTAIKNTITLTPKSGICDGRFLYYLLTFVDIPKRGAGQPFISKGDLQKYAVRVPPLHEQRQVGRVLSAVQRAIERQERLIAVTAELKKALMHKLFTEGTRGEPLKPTEIGPVPKSWEVKRVVDLCKLVSGGTPSKANAAFWNGPIPWASPKDMKQSRLSDTEDHIHQAGLENGSRLVPAGSIFVVIRGMILMRDVPIAQAMVPMAFNQDMKALVEHNGVLSDFLLYSLQHARERLLRKVGSSAHGTRTLMTSAIEQLPVAVPSGSEQEAISQVLKMTEAKQSIHQRTADRLREFFRALLHQLMTAQVHVHDFDLSALDELAAEPAEVR